MLQPLHVIEHSCCQGDAKAGVIDPVCGMNVDPAKSAGSHVHEGTTYHFCSKHCLAKFQAEPQQYLAKKPADRTMPSSSGSAGKYTCPMHPEVVQDGPGSCPKCGMALEPMQPSLEESPDPELVSMQRRFWIGLTLTVPIFMIAMGGLLPWPALTHYLHDNMGLLNWVQLILATPVVLWCGWPFFERAWHSIVNRSPNMFTLIALGVGAAYVYSVLATIAPGIFPEGFRTMGNAVEPYFDSAAVIVVLVLLGQVLELRARMQTEPRFALCWDSFPRQRALSEKMAKKAMCPWNTWRSATACGFVLGKSSGRWVGDRRTKRRGRIDDHGRTHARRKKRQTAASLAVL